MAEDLEMLKRRRLKEFEAQLRGEGKPLDERSHSELWNARAQRPDTDLDQSLLAPFEHKAFAREFVRENPLAAPGMVLMAPGYALAKALRLRYGRTKPSMDQVFAGVEGTGQGLADAFEDLKARFNADEE